jgi:glutamate dehydrogenase (NAD(P)+)
MIQNASLDRWPLATVHARLDERLTTGYRDMHAAAERHGVHPRLGGYLVAVARVAEAVRLRGWV